MELEIVEVAEDRFQVVDRRGRIMDATNSRRESEAFVRGYGASRADTSTIVRNTVEPLLSRLAVDRS